MIEKYIRDDGSVAVLVSPGYGAGWSTWNSDRNNQFLMFDKGLVSLAMKKASEEEVDSYITSKLGPGHEYILLAGWEDVKVFFLPSGTKFSIEEYDGYETLKKVDDLKFTA